jgi:limonene-1,2-epoxide hydrolase
MSSAEQVVRDFCAAASTRDPAVLRAYFSDDVVYHNIPADPAEGIDATMAVIEMFAACARRSSSRCITLQATARRCSPSELTRSR